MWDAVALTVGDKIEIEIQRMFLVSSAPDA
jgi:hypothetical protein